jgi:hypothetical protein
LIPLKLGVALEVIIDLALKPTRLLFPEGHTILP